MNDLSAGMNWLAQHTIKNGKSPSKENKTYLLY